MARRRSCASTAWLNGSAWARRALPQFLGRQAQRSHTGGPLIVEPGRPRLQVFQLLQAFPGLLVERHHLIEASSGAGVLPLQLVQ